MNRLHEFDALRGIAALTVVFAHLSNYLPAEVSDPYDHWSLPLWSFGANGHLAVLIFFAISGFVLSYPYFIGAKSQRNLTVDVVNRLPRLLIPVFLTGLLCYAMQAAAVRWAGGERLAPFASPKWIARWNVEEWDLARVVEFLLTRVFFFYSETDTMNENLWTMPIEFAFSLAVFAICALSLRRFSFATGLGIAAVLCVISWRAGMLEYFLKGLAGGVFFLGVLVAWQVERIRSTVRRFVTLPILLMISGLLLSSVALRHDVHYLMKEALGLLSIALFFVGFVSATRLATFLKGRVFALLGEMSFALYLVHGSVLYLVFQVIASTGEYDLARFALGCALSLAIVLPLSLAIARYIEMPLVSRVRRAIKNAVGGAKTA